MNKFSPWLSLLPLLLVYAVLVFVVSSLTELTDGTAILYSYAVFYPILMLSGAWAVLGPGSYAVRTICSIAVVLTIFLAGALGICITFPDELSLTDLQLICWLGIPLICTAQLPYWLGRLIFGWQLIDSSKPPKQKKINLKEMLTITAVLAVCVAALTQTNLMSDPINVDRVEIGDTELVAVGVTQSGEIIREEVIVSEGNIDRFRQRQAANAAEAAEDRLLFGGFIVFIALSTLVNILCFYLGMNNKNPVKGFCFAALYWLAPIFILFFASITIWPPPRAESDFVFLNGIFLSLLFIGAAATPMLVVRRNGGMMVSREFFLQQSKNYESPASKKVVNPFDD